MTRCAADRRVFFFEEPEYGPWRQASVRIERTGNLTVVVPLLPETIPAADVDVAQRALLNDLIARERMETYVLWYYTPMALSFTDHLRPAAIVYDCMDELSAFKGASATMSIREQELMRRAALVLTGGQSLYEAKRHLHPNIHPFPSSVDVAHFAQARQIDAEPEDQASIPHPRLGFFGVIDERMDLALLDAVARAKPDWQFMMLGPVVTIDSASLPRHPNMHYLGPKAYGDLPLYVGGWDVALMPYARNEATRFISPTTTLEYLAAGKPVVSTSIHDVVRPYGQQGLVRIADDPQSFVQACRAAMIEDRAARSTRADAFLRQTSWDGTWTRIRRLLDEALNGAAPAQMAATP